MYCATHNDTWYIYVNKMLEYLLNQINEDSNVGYVIYQKKPRDYKIGKKIYNSKYLLNFSKVA